MPLLLLVVLAVLATIALVPVSIVQRYRMGTSRRLARGWVATLNIVTLGFSIVCFVITAALSSIWLPRALGYTLAGLAAGVVLGLLGLALSRWEPTDRFLYYTPNRVFVLTMTLIVAARVAYGFWRAAQTWHLGLGTGSWLAAWGAAESMGAGATVLGYYATYWGGVRRRVRRFVRTGR